MAPTAGRNFGCGRVTVFTRVLAREEDSPVISTTNWLCLNLCTCLLASIIHSVVPTAGRSFGCGRVTASSTREEDSPVISTPNWLCLNLCTRLLASIYTLWFLPPDVVLVVGV